MFWYRLAAGALKPYVIFFILLLLTVISAFLVLHVTNATRIEWQKQESLTREYASLLEERDNLYLEKEVLSDSVRIEVLAKYELNMRPIQPSDNAASFIQ